MFIQLAGIDRSHAPRGNAATDAPRSALYLGRGASRAAFPRRAWERSVRNKNARRNAWHFV
ncbi:DUF1534 domain-containing protein [Pseudomonas fluorescens]|nr:DUF1534 domain-containing protein [Pseudomonas fluorescens]